MNRLTRRPHESRRLIDVLTRILREFPRIIDLLTRRLRESPRLIDVLIWFVREPARLIKNYAFAWGVIVPSICFVFTIVPAWSMPPTIVVKLFDAYAPVDEVTIKGPLQITEPINKSIEGRNLKLVAKGTRVAVYVSSRPESSNLESAGAEHFYVGASSDRSRSARPSTTAHSGASAEPLVVGRRIVLSALTPRGIEVQRAPRLRRFYRGVLTVTANSAEYGGKGMRFQRIYGLPSRQRKVGINLFNEVSTRDYVASVVGSELPAHCPEEASKAIAVLAFNIVETKPPGSIVPDTTAQQAYRGNEHVTPSIEASVAAVAGKTLLNGNAVAKVFYHSTCAGGTSSGEAIFGDSARGLTYLKPVKCEYCKGSPFWKEKRTVVKREVVQRIFGGAFPVIQEADASGRPTVVGLSKNNSKVPAMSGYECWLKLGRNLGWRVAPSTKFAIEPKKRALKYGWYRLDKIEIVSSGAGHGVGLCQWGAIGMANEGKKYDEILRFYFPGTTLN